MAINSWRFLSANNLRDYVDILQGEILKMNIFTEVSKRMEESMVNLTYLA